MSADIAIIAEVPIFELLDDAERADLAQRMDCREFKQGDILFDYGSPGGEIFILRSGSVEVFVEDQQGDRIVLGESGGGGVGGALSFFAGGPRAPTGTDPVVART